MTFNYCFKKELAKTGHLGCPESSLGNWRFYCSGPKTKQNIFTWSVVKNWVWNVWHQYQPCSGVYKLWENSSQWPHFGMKSPLWSTVHRAFLVLPKSVFLPRQRVLKNQQRKKIIDWEKVEPVDILFAFFFFLTEEEMLVLRSLEIQMCIK